MPDERNRDHRDVFDDYDWATFISIEPIDWSRNGPEWQAWLRRAVEERGRLTFEGSRFDDTTKPFLQMRAAGAGVDLLIAPLVNGDAVVYAGGRDTAIEEATDVVDAWAEAVRDATSRLGSPGPSFAWTAIVGPPSPRITGGERTVADPVVVGGMRLSRSPVPLVEAFASPAMPTLTGATFGQSWPVLVEGSSQGVDWSAACRRAAQELHRLTSLLSIAWEQPVVVREPPAAADWGPRTVPERIFWQSHEHLATEVGEPQTIEMPPWLDAGWSAMTSVPRIENAAGAYLQGLLTHREHPSLSLVAFIASIEAIGTTLFKPRRCKTCRTIRHIGAMFRATLSMVVDSEEAERLGAAYNSRSRTVHDAVLHGSESYRGALPTFDPWVVDDALAFEWSITWRMQRAARLLLVRAMTGDLPARTSAPDPEAGLHEPRGGDGSS